MNETLIRASLGDLRISAVFFDEAFYLDEEAFVSSAGEPEHRHADYEIFFILEGTLTVRGGRTILRTEKNTAVILPPLFEHITCGEGVRGYCMYFNPERGKRTENLRYEQIVAALRDKITALPMEEDAVFYAEQLAKTALSPVGDLREEHLTALLFSSLLRPLFADAADSVGKNRRYINRIDLFIHEHYRENLHLSDLSRALYLCPKQITRIIRKKYNCSFSDLLHAHRLSLACALLTNTEDSIAAVAQEVGYEYENYFYRLFRKKYGMTPQEFRKNRRNRENTVDTETDL